MGGFILLVLVSSGLAAASDTGSLRLKAEKNPRSAAAQTELGHALREDGNVREAIECFRRVVVLEPASAAAHADLGYALSRNDQLREAIVEFRKATALSPKFAAAHFLLAEALSRAGQSAVALPEYEVAATLKPDDPEFLIRYGSALSKTRPHDAVSPLRRAVSVDPSNHIARQALGLALRRTGDESGAAREFKEARNLSQAKDRRNEAETLTNRGIELLSGGSVPESLTIFEKALSIEPELAVAHHYKALALSSVGRWKEANQEFEEALHQSGSDPEIHYNFGVVLSHQGRRQEAAREFSTVLELRPDHPQAACSLAKTLLAAGDRDKASGFFARARDTGVCAEN